MRCHALLQGSSRPRDEACVSYVSSTGRSSRTKGSQELADRACRMWESRGELSPNTSAPGISVGSSPVAFISSYWQQPMFTKQSVTTVASQSDPAPLCAPSQVSGSLLVEVVWLLGWELSVFPPTQLRNPSQLFSIEGSCLEFHGFMGSCGQSLGVDVYLCV